MNEWGRVFFIYENTSLKNVYAQPLSNHSGNCRALLERFDEKYFDSMTKDLLFRAVDRHDDGKRETFRIIEDQPQPSAANRPQKGKKSNNSQIPQTKNNKKKLRYSFAGHRFRVSDDSPYISTLIRAHHEFSVSEVNRARAVLESPEQKKRFPNDLYLLCMADQLEAELAVKTVEKRDSVPRTFMEFVTVPKDAIFRSYSVIPWPFRENAFALSFELFELASEHFDDENSEKIEKALMNKPLSIFKRIEISIRVSGDTGNGY